MSLLIAGLVIFFGVHLLPVFGDWRAQLIGKFGEAIYKTLFSIVSAIGFVMLLMGKGRADFVPLYGSPDWSTKLALFTMLPAFVLLVAAYIPCRIKQVVGHPMLLAILLWSSVHLLANGDQASVLLFGSFLLYAIIDLAMSSRPEPSNRKLAWWSDIIVVLIGVAVYVLVFKIHSVAFAPIILG